MFNKFSLNHQLLTPPVRVGIIGTGYVAQRRAEALQEEQRSQLRFVVGHSADNTAKFAQTYQVSILESWQQLVNHPELDLVIICTINRDHGPITEAALLAGKHVVVEYPLAFKYPEAENLVNLAHQQQLFLHIEHIEILGGLHQAMRRYLPEIGNVFYARYLTFSKKYPVQKVWSYHKQQFGFPLVAALSRIHRFTDLFAEVESVDCNLRYWNASDPDYFKACLCKAQLKFTNNLLADIIYGKGEIFSQSDRTFEVHGNKGILIFAGDQGKLITEGNTIPLDIGSRRGLFKQDTQMVLDALIEGKPLYVTPVQSNYSLKIANAAAESVAKAQLLKL